MNILSSLFEQGELFFYPSAFPSNECNDLLLRQSGWGQHSDGTVRADGDGDRLSSRSSDDLVGKSCHMVADSGVPEGMDF